MNLDYAALYEARRHDGRRWAGLRYAGVLAVWLGLFLVRPGLALDIWANRTTVAL